jgi:hypothetical protein
MKLIDLVTEKLRLTAFNSLTAIILPQITKQIKVESSLRTRDKISSRGIFHPSRFVFNIDPFPLKSYCNLIKLN